MNPRADDDRVDQAVLALLLHAPARGPWAIEEIAREIGDRLAVIDSLARLYGAGLVHRLDHGFVFPTRAAMRAEQLAG